MTTQDHQTKTPSKNTEDERRKETRFSTYLASVLEQEEHSVYTTVINLSEKGVGFLSAKPFELGDIVNINFSYHNQEVEPIKLKVRVQSCNEVDFEYYIGGVIISKTEDFQDFYLSTIPYVY